MRFLLSFALVLFIAVFSNPSNSKILSGGGSIVRARNLGGHSGHEDYGDGSGTTLEEEASEETTQSDFQPYVYNAQPTPAPPPPPPPPPPMTTTTGAPVSLEVQTKNGILRGKLIKVKAKCSETKVVSEKEVYAFLGVPFANPPINQLRFKRPVRKDKWSGVLSATTLPNSCIQTIGNSFPGFSGETQWNPNTNQSEDCLYLNLWIPASVFRNKDSAAKVLFWIYGGGFYSGTSTLPLYDGASLAAHHDVIVVSSQYRVGPFGFIYFGTDDAPGNLGLLDQNFALQWVNDNVGAFGGNPSEVTLMGESAGAACVTFQLLSPLSRSLFKRAIIMSGVATASWALRPKAEAIEIAYKLAKEVGCWSDDSRSDVSQVVDCLRKADPKALINNQWSLVSKIFSFPFIPTIDDYFLLDTPNNLVQSWDTKKAEVMIGTVADEGTYFTLYSFPKHFNRNGPPHISYDVFISTLRDVFKDRPVYERDAIVAQYTNWKNLEDGVENGKRINEAIGDAFFVCPSRDFAQKWSSRGLSVYYYSFTHRTVRNPWPEWAGVMHSDKIEFALGQPIQHFHRENDVDVSLKFMELIANFMKTGTPSENWEKYTPEYPVYLDINGTTISDRSARQVFGPRAPQCAFWNNYLPRLRQNVEANSCPAPSPQDKLTRACGGDRSTLARIGAKLRW